jgi:phenylacetate-CoA ligase
VALLIDTLTGGGAEGVVYRLALGLAGRGHQVFVYCLRSAGRETDELRAAGVVVREGHGEGRQLRLMWRLAGWLRSDRIDVAHAHSSAAMVSVLPVAKLLGIPVMHTRHSLRHGRPTREHVLARRLAPLLNGLTIVAEPLRERLSAGWRERAVYTPNGIDAPVVERAAARRRLEHVCGGPLDGPVIVSVANIRPEKDTRGLLQAFALLRRQHSDARLVCLGQRTNAAYWEQVQQNIAVMGLQRVVHLPGYRADAGELMAGADVFCLSSRTEALPLAVLEAMSQGVPIVATAVGGVGRLDRAAGSDRYVLQQGRSALLVPPEDPEALARALDGALTDRARAAERVVQARADYERHFTAERMVQRYEELYVASGVGRGRRKRGRRPRVMMVGPAPPEVGGMVTSIGLLMDSPLRETCELHRFATTIDPATLTQGRTAGKARPTGWLGPVSSIVRHVKTLGAFVGEVVRRRIDLVHVHTCSGFTFYRNLLDLAAAKLLGRAVILHIRGGRFAEFCAGGSRLRRWLIRRGLEWADAVIVLSPGWARVLRRHAGHARLLSLPNTFGTPALLASPRVDERRPCRLLYMAPLSEAKGLGDLLEAARRLRAEHVPFTLDIAGPAGPAGLERWQRQVHEAGLDEIARFVGPVHGRAKAGLLAAADCFVHPSHSEGLPNAILEAGATGLPVISTDVGAVGEVYAPLAGVLGPDEPLPLVPPRQPAELAEQMRRFARNADICRRFGTAFRTHLLEHYGQERVSERLAAIYGDVLSRRRGGRRTLTMPESLVRHVVWPVFERVRKRQTPGEVRALERLVLDTPQRVPEESARRLSSLLQFAGTHLPYYAEQFARYGVRPQADEPYAELARLPVLHKADVRANAERMTWRDVPGGLLPAVSGGTTGDTLHFFVDRVRNSQSLAARLFMQQLWGVRPGDRRMWFWGSPRELKESPLYTWRDRLLNEIMLDAFDISTARLDEYLRRIVAYRPRLLSAYASAGLLLARHAAKRYGPRDFPWLQAFVLTGDEIHDEHRRAIGEVFGCPVVSEYGSREVGLIGYECPQGRLHVVSPHIHVEITQNDERVPDGTFGNVTCTNLNTRAQPLLRYRLGDVGAISPAGCPCGLPLPVLEIRAARITGFVAMPGGRLRDGHLVAYLVRVDPGVVEFKVHQRTLEQFDVLLVVNERFTADSIAGIQQRFHGYFGPQVQVNCIVVDAIPPDPSGKRRYMVSDVAPRLERYEVEPSPPAVAGAINRG